MINFAYKDDFIANKNNTKGLFILLFFRFSHHFTKSPVLRLVGFPVRVLYRIVVVWLLGCDLPDSTNVGRGLRIYHGQGLVVNHMVVIGNFVTLRQNTTIGTAKSGQLSPYLEDFVEIGANSVIIGDVHIGSGAVVGAGSVVLDNVPSRTLVAGNPAVFKKEINTNSGIDSIA